MRNFGVKLDDKWTDKFDEDLTTASVHDDILLAFPLHFFTELRYVSYTV